MSGATWSATKLKTWHRCARLFSYRYGLGIGEPSTDVTAFGSVGHAYLEHDALTSIGAKPDPVAPLPDAYEQARLQAVLDGYRLRWEGTRWHILGVEVPFSFDLAGHVINGRMDMLVQDLDDGRDLVVEHKFTSSDASPGSTYWEKLTLDLQASIYLDGASMVLGRPVAGVMYDVIAKPAHKVKRATPPDQRKYTKATKTQESRLHANQRETDETPDEFYDRIVAEIAERPSDFYARALVVRTEDELPKMRADILETIKLARIAEMFDVHPRNAEACNRFGSRCWFWDACTSAADINDVIRFPRRAHVESLAPVTQP